MFLVLFQVFLLVLCGVFRVFPLHCLCTGFPVVVFCVFPGFAGLVVDLWFVICDFAPFAEFWVDFHCILRVFLVLICVCGWFNVVLASLLFF